MFLSIYHNQSGEEYIRRLSPSEKIDPETHFRKWIDDRYDGEVKVSESDGHIPRGCGEYYIEIRDTKESTGSCWSSFDAFTEMECES